MSRSNLMKDRTTIRIRVLAAIALPAATLALTTGAAVNRVRAATVVRAASTSPQEVRLDSIMRGLQRHFDETRSFQANFIEKITPIGGSPRTRSGTVAYRKPGRMRWEFAPPQAETIVSDGTTVYAYEPDLNQVIETPVKSVVRSASATSFLLGLGSLRRDFDASLPPARADSPVQVVLTPKGGGDRIELTVAPGSYDLLKLKLTDALGDVTRLRFTDLKSNVALDDSLFSFKVPDGVDVVSGAEMP